MEKRTMQDYIYEVPKKMRENIDRAEQLVKPLIDYIGDKEVNKITFVKELMEEAV